MHSPFFRASVLKSITMRFMPLNVNEIERDIGDFFFSNQWLFSLGIVILSLLGICLLVLIIFFTYRTIVAKRFRHRLIVEGCTVRIIRIDLLKDKATYFNLGNLRDVHEKKLDAFYASFPPKDEPRFRTWVNDLLEGRETDPFLELDVSFGKDKTLYHSFLRAANVNRGQGILHLENRLLHAETTHSHKQRIFSTYGEFAKAYRDDKDGLGFTICFSLLPRRAKAKGISFDHFRTRMSRELSARFRDYILHEVKGNEIAILASDNEIVVASFDMKDSAQVIDLALSTIHRVNARLSKFRKEGLMEVRAGIVDNSTVPLNPESALSGARAAASQAFESSSPVVFMNRALQEENNDDVESCRSEVERIMATKKLQFYYRPVYSMEKKRTIGFLSKVVPVGTSFADIDELKGYAIRAQDDKNLFAHIAKNLIPRFLNERELKTQKLFYPVSASEIKLLLPFFSRYKSGKEANLVFLFKEDDILFNMSGNENETLIANLRKIKASGYHLAIEVAGSSLQLDNNIYSEMDFFFVDFSTSTDKRGMDTQIRSQLHALVERLLKYKKPIVGNYLFNWNAIELVVGSGIQYLSSEAIAPFDQMLKPLGNKVHEKLKVLQERK